MQWIEIITGIELLRHMMLLQREKEIKLQTAVQAVADSYAVDKTDEFVIPTVIMENDAPVATVNDKDSVIFFNFRPDRARQITRAFCADDFDGFDREKRLDLVFVCFTEYDVTIPNKLIAFKKVEITNTFGEYLSCT